MKNRLLAFALLCAAGAAALAWKFYRENEDLRLAAARAVEEKRTMSDQNAELKKENASLRKTAEEAQQQAKVAENNLNESRRSASTENAGPANNRSYLDSAMSAMAALDNPEMIKMMAVQQRGALNGRYATLFKNLHLDSTHLSQFKDLLVERQMVNMDVLMAAAKQGINPLQNPLDIARFTRSAHAEIDEKIKNLLGDDGYAQFQNYQNTQPQRTVVTQLEQSLSYTDSPLTPDQGEQVVKLLLNASSQRDLLGNLANASLGVPGRGLTISDEAIARAGTVLSPVQVEALREIQQQQRAALQSAQLLRASRSGQTPNGSPGAPASASGK
jgi:hypothetical protein